MKLYLTTALVVCLYLALMSPSSGIKVGEDAKDDEAPFYVRLIVSPAPWSDLIGYGGGILISERHILTAAHNMILMMFNGGHFSVVFRNSDAVHQLDSQQVTIHPDFMRRLRDISKYDNDLAIITLPTPVLVHGNVRPAKLQASRHKLERKQVEVFGFGRTVDELQPVRLQKAKISLDSKKCEAAYNRGGRVVFNDTEQMCLDSERAATCKGDSGGPLVYKNEVVGVISWGEVSCNLSIPSVASRVNNYLSWIRQVMHETSRRNAKGPKIEL